MRFKKIFTTILVVMTLIVIATIGLAASALSETYAFRAGYNYSIHDATKLQRIIAQIETANEYSLELYDINQNGRLDIFDATLIQRYCAEMITISDETTEAEVTTEPRVSVTYLSPKTCSLSLGVNETYTLHYLSDADMLLYSSENDNVASVDNNGTITAKSEGITTIVCSAGDSYKAECFLTVGKEATSLSLNATNLTLGVGEQYDLNSYVPSGTVAHSRVYTSDNKAVASVEAGGGLVTAKSVGKSKVYCTLKNGVSAVCEITVLPPAKTISLNTTELTLGVGETFDVDSYVPAGTASHYRRYYSDNPAIATVKESGGLITAISPGNISIKCKTGTGAEATVSLIVTSEPKTISFNLSNINASVGKNCSLTVSTGCGNDNNRLFQYSSSNPYVVKISKTQNNVITLTPMSLGSVTVTAKSYNGKIASCTITVNNSDVKCIDISTWQGGDVDFSKVKASGINYVIIRAGFGTKKDNQFENNYAKAKAAGMKIGIYWFSYATNDYGGITEANACLNVLNGRKIDMPVYFDVEYLSSYASHKQMVYNFCDTIKKSGYKTGVYASASDYTSYFSPSDFYGRGYSVWNAHWAKTTPVVCDIWQYSEKGRVSGISTNVDMNTVYNLNIAE